MTTFNPLDPNTWPQMLTLKQVAAIWQRPVGGIRKQLQRHTFQPAPKVKHPYRFRKCDVLRYVRPVPLQKAS